MASAPVLGQGTTYNLPNYVGELFALTPQDTPFVTAIGGLTGGRKTRSTKFGWQSYDERPGESDRVRLEGANAPQAENRKRVPHENVVEIHHEAVEVSYTKQAAVNLIDHVNQAGVEGSNPVTDEFEWQVDKQLKAIKRDIEHAFLLGTFNEGSEDGSGDAEATDARRTRGIKEAITTNVKDVDGGTGADAILSLDLLNDISEMAWKAGGLAEGETATIMLNSVQKRNLTAAAKAAGLEAPRTSSVGGVNVTTIETDFGRFNVMLNRYLPDSDLLVLSLEECAPVFLEIPGKGFLFVEPLAKSGSAEKAQIYGEVGLWYGNELKHGRLANLNVEVQSISA